MPCSDCMEQTERKAVVRRHCVRPRWAVARTAIQIVVIVAISAVSGLVVNAYNANHAVHRLHHDGRTPPPYQPR